VPPFSEANSGFDKIRQERPEWIAPQHQAMSEFEQSGKHLLTVSSSQFDPNQRLARVKRSPQPHQAATFAVLPRRYSRSLTA
jgi:hypothetical protein